MYVMYVCMYVCMYVYESAYAYAYIYIHICIIYIYMYIVYIYIYKKITTLPILGCAVWVMKGYVHDNNLQKLAYGPPKYEIHI